MCSVIGLLIISVCTIQQQRTLALRCAPHSGTSRSICNTCYSATLSWALGKGFCLCCLFPWCLYRYERVSGIILTTKLKPMNQCISFNPTAVDSSRGASRAPKFRSKLRVRKICRTNHTTSKLSVQIQQAVECPVQPLLSTLLAETKNVKARLGYSQKASHTGSLPFVFR